MKMGKDKKGDHSIMTAKEVCAYLKIPLSTLYGLTKRHRIPGIKVGKHWRYQRKDIRKLVLGWESVDRIHQTRATQARDRRQHSRINCGIQAQFSTLLDRKQRLTCTGMIHNISPLGAMVILQI